MRRDGFDEVTNTREAIAMRNYRLRSMKQEKSLSEILFPGQTPRDYLLGEALPVRMDLVRSRKTLMPLRYENLPVCRYPQPRMRMAFQALGPRLLGYERASGRSPYRFVAGENKECTPLCFVRLVEEDLVRTRELINNQYRMYLEMDGLPMLMRSAELNYAVRGVPLGFKFPAFGRDTLNGNFVGDHIHYQDDADEKFFLYNHLKFLVTYRRVGGSGERNAIRITGFDVHPVTIDHKRDADSGDVSTCRGPYVANDISRYFSLSAGESGHLDVVYSYDVEWVENNDLAWADRWDVYFVGAPGGDLYHYGLIHSLAKVLVVAGVVAAFVVRSLRGGSGGGKGAGGGYDRLPASEDDDDENDAENDLSPGEPPAVPTTGWKAVRRSVFLPPRTLPVVLSALVGTGAQIGCALGGTLVLSSLGAASFAVPGQVLTLLLFLYASCGLVGGAVSSLLCGVFGCCKKAGAFATAAGLPALFLAAFLVLNAFVEGARASTAASEATIGALFLLWTAGSFPMVSLGAYGASWAKPAPEPSKDTGGASDDDDNDADAADVPNASRAARAAYYLLVLVGATLPMNIAGPESQLVLSCLWLGRAYLSPQAFYLPATMLSVAALSALVAIGLCFFQLCREDHRWWWRSFWNPALAGFYFFLYGLYFMDSRLSLAGSLSVAIYLVYTSMMAVCFGLFCGSVGLLSSLGFVRFLYGRTGTEERD